jgi:hypothetical protein
VTETRMLALIGAGETGPTMVTTHRDLVSRTGARTPRAIVLATPYAFQVNAPDVSAKARDYFRSSVGLAVSVTAGTSADADPAMAPPMVAAGQPGEAAAIRTADWVFAGPGSPTYALAHWQAGSVAAALRDRVLGGRGVTVLASAAAATAGRLAFPVYEIYKAGAAPRWLPGLDLLGPLGLRVAVIPHYDNAEGNGYDTRYCYLGEDRLAWLERELPEGTAILGIGENTALVIDLAAGTAGVRGRGEVTLRRHGGEWPLPAGVAVTLDHLRDLTHGVPGPQRAARSRPAAAAPDKPATPVPLPDLMRRALAEREPRRLTEAILGLEAAIREWAFDTEEDQGTEQATAVLRTLIGRLGDAAARAGPGVSAAEVLRPAVRPLLALRASLRDQGHYPAADAIRNALVRAGLEIRDTPDGTWWEPQAAPEAKP